MRGRGGWLRWIYRSGTAGRGGDASWDVVVQVEAPAQKDEITFPRTTLCANVVEEAGTISWLPRRMMDNSDLNVLLLSKSCCSKNESWGTLGHRKSGVAASLGRVGRCLVLLQHDPTGAYRRKARRVSAFADNVILEVYVDADQMASLSRRILRADSDRSCLLCRRREDATRVLQASSCCRKRLGHHHRYLRLVGLRAAFASHDGLAET
jgi:hypothetical protein